MSRALTTGERRSVLQSAVTVALADGILAEPELRSLDALSRALELEPHAVDRAFLRARIPRSDAPRLPVCEIEVLAAAWIAAADGLVVRAEITALQSLARDRGLGPEAVERALDRVRQVEWDLATSGDAPGPLATALVLLRDGALAR